MSLNEASAFIRLLAADCSVPVCIRLIDDNKARKLPAIKLFGLIEDLWPRIEEQQQEGFGAFIVINGGGNKDDEITDVRALFIDLDNKPLPEAWHELPDAIVSRDDTHHHVYWWTDTDIPVSEFTDIQLSLAQHYDGDPQVSNPSRVMRLPGTLHQKDPTNIKSYQLVATPWSGDYRYRHQLTSGLASATTKIKDPKPAPPGGVELDLHYNITKARNFLSVRDPATEEDDTGQSWTHETCLVLTRDLAISPETALDLMFEEWNDRCTPPWEPDELLEMLKRTAAPKGGQNEIGAQALTADPLTRFASIAGGYESPSEPADDPFKPWKPSELLLRPPPAWHFPGIIPKESVGALIAPSDSGKTFFALHCGLILATGIEGMGRGASSPRNVLYIPMEGSRDISHNRLPAWQHKHGVSQETIDNFRVVENFPDVLDGDRVARLIQRQRDEGLNVDLLFVDTYGRAMGEADLDENKAAEVRRFVRQTEAIKRLMGCTIILIHHTSKAGDAAGSYALKADSDFWMNVETNWDAGAMAVICGKMKGAARFSPLYFGVHPTENSLTLEGILPNEYKALTVVDDELSQRSIQVAMSNAKAFGDANAVSAYVLASHIYVPQLGEPQMEVEAKWTRLARKVTALGQGRDEHLVSAAGWRFPE